jgi:hypothetical protein
MKKRTSLDKKTENGGLVGKLKEVAVEIDAEERAGHSGEGVERRALASVQVKWVRMVQELPKSSVNLKAAYKGNVKRGRPSTRHRHYLLRERGTHSMGSYHQHT